MDMRAEAGYAASATIEGTSGEKTVTEAEWLACDDPWPMLWSLGGLASERKLRLLACAFCRRIWQLLPGEASRLAVEAAEQFADGAIRRSRLEAAWRAARAESDDLAAVVALGSRSQRAAVGMDAAQAAVDASARAPRPQDSAAHGARALATQAGLRDAGGHRGRGTSAEVPPEFVAQCALVRDLFGNPSRRVAAPQRAWLRWNDATVPRMGGAIYDERAFDRLPVLADALEDAGCADPDWLGHLREPGPHARGCWPVDLLLGKA